MRMDFRVTYTDGRVVDAIARPKDVVAFERQYGTSFARFGDEKNQPPMEWLYYLAWSPLHRGGQEPAAFDEFLDLVDEIDATEDEPSTDPTQPAASDDSLPGSPSEAA